MMIWVQGKMRKNQDRFLISSFLVFAISACRAQATPITEMSPFSPTNTGQPITIQVNTEVPITPHLISCDDWQSLPVIPVVSGAVRELYERGQAGGNDPHAFSKIGDGEISAAWFFTAFDLGGDYYDLGLY